MEIEINKPVVIANKQIPIITKFQMIFNGGIDETRKWTGMIEYAVKNEKGDIISRKKITMTASDWNDFGTGFDTFSRIMERVFQEEGYTDVIPTQYEESFYNVL